MTVDYEYRGAREAQQKADAAFDRVVAGNRRRRKSVARDDSPTGLPQACSEFLMWREAHNDAAGECGVRIEVRRVSSARPTLHVTFRNARRRVLADYWPGTRRVRVAGASCLVANHDAALALAVRAARLGV